MSEVLPMSTYPIGKKTLEEDEDQGEMDTIFFLSLFVYSLYLFSINILYPDSEEKDSVGKFNLVMSNLWAFYPIMQAQGLWLKFLLIATTYYSICWHWTNVGMKLPGDVDHYRVWDALFSVCIIVSYSLTWLPKLKTYEPTPEQNKTCWYHNCRGKPKETSEWRCRWTTSLLINMFITIIIGALIYTTDAVSGYSTQISVCWIFISFAFITAIYQLIRGDMKVGKKNRMKFAFWAFIGIVFGCISFSCKMTSNVFDSNSNIYHSGWHAYVFSCAYSFSRASEYLEIY